MCKQLVVIDYRIMQNSSAAMELRGQVMPPELKTLEEALKKSGLNDNNDLEQLAFVLYRPNGNSEADDVRSVGIAPGPIPRRLKFWRTSKSRRSKPRRFVPTRSTPWARPA